MLATARRQQMSVRTSLLIRAVWTSCFVLFGTRNVRQTNSRNPVLPLERVLHRNVWWDLVSAVNSTGKGHRFVICTDLWHLSFHTQIRSDLCEPKGNCKRTCISLCVPRILWTDAEALAPANRFLFVPRDYVYTTSQHVPQSSKRKIQDDWEFHSCKYDYYCLLEYDAV
jgi:hypothetical protein